MNLKDAGESLFTLFNMAAVGLAGIDGSGRVLRVNGSFVRYLDIDREAVLGGDLSSLHNAILSEEFWDALPESGRFRCLVPGRHHLLLTFGTNLPEDDPGGMRRFILLRPYSLEREFVRMRSRLNRNVVLEISEHLSSVAVAGDIILQPELQEEEGVRKRFLSTFFGDVNDLGQLISALQEIAEPIPFPARIRTTPLDWRSMTVDLLSKMKGLAGEKNVSLTSDLPTDLPTVQGDYHWLNLALYGILNHAMVEAPTLGEVTLQCRALDGRLETLIGYIPPEESEPGPWPPQTLFHLSDEGTGGGSLGLTDLALSRSIFLLHRGSVDRKAEGGKVNFISSLPI